MSAFDKIRRDQLLEDMTATKEAAEDLCTAYTKYLASREFLKVKERAREDRRFHAAFNAVKTEISILREEVDELRDVA